MAIDIHNPTPLYRQIIADIKRQISSGELQPGDKIPSQNELSREYGVSLLTVKQARAELINSGLLYSRVGKGVFVAQKRKTTDPAAQQTIGLVLRDLKDPFFSLIVHSVEEKLSELGYNLLISSSRDREEREETQISRLRDFGVSGMIIASMSYLHRATPKILELQKEKFPFVMVSFVQNEDVNYVGTDHEHGAYLATEHLINLGNERVGYLNSEEGNVLGELRQQGYVRALDTHGRSLNEDFVYPIPMPYQSDHYKGGYQVGLHIAGLNRRPDALFAYNDLSALGFEAAVLSQGLRVPDDISIVGFDDIERDLHAPVPLTTIHQPTRRIGIAALETLIRKIEGDEEVTRTFLEPRLVVRESCGARRNPVDESSRATSADVNVLR
ncbi:MAG: GntR family transcriptional regulator [Fidelibacterota bacterium]|nr:MAG: GntR family transcriptional regulator [Candidatus Neomarinimicrobiota bacterium]